MLQGISVSVSMSLFGFSAGCAGAHMVVAAGLLFAASVATACGVVWPQGTKEFFEDFAVAFFDIDPR